jgi:hypothetical protein
VIPIKPECRMNAICVLNNLPAMYIGSYNDLDYYILDGKAWSVHKNGMVERSDDDEETRDIVTLLCGEPEEPELCP